MNSQPPAAGMTKPLHVDHVFVMCDEGAPEAELLVRAGLLEGPPNTHPGQGTACRRFFFRNMYLELAWVHDRAEAQSAGVRPLAFFDRWTGRRSSACPFGIMLRSPGEALPFRTWSYRPVYVPPGAAFDVAHGTTLDEPFVCHFVAAQPTDLTPGVEHRIPTTRVLEVRVGTPSGLPASSAGQWLASSGLVSFFPSPAWLLELNFSMTPTATIDLRPHLPLILQYQATR